MPTHNASEEVPKRGWRCPDEEQLAAYIDGTARGEAKLSIERHISGCGYCLKLVVGATAEARQSSPSTPSYLLKRAEELAGSQPREWRWAWAMGPALACLIAVAIYVRQPQRVKPATEPATNPPAAAASAPNAPATGSVATPSEPTRALGREPGTLRLLAPARDAVLDRGHLQFAWTTVPNTSYYQIRITTTEGGLAWETRSTQASVRPPDKLKLAPGQYFIWVTAYLNNGRTERSDPLEFRLQEDR
ncbi:MAG TPA: hypothetical protein VFO34_05450 [Candidatus Acidoferrales bacterium]|nr:hypothetical protein [Candidatus Acidoferrales bacterium]